MKKQILRKLPLFAAICLTLSLSSCVKEKFGGYEPGITNDRANVVLRLKTPGSFSTPTRALSVEQENTIDNVYILAFKGVGDDLTLSYIVTGVNPAAGGSPDVTTFNATLAASQNSGDTYKLMVIANAKSIVEDVFGDDLQSYSDPDKSYATIQQKLKFTLSGKLFSGGSGDVIPMWGTTSDFMEIKNGLTIPTLNLLRAIARVDVGVGAPFKETDGTFTWNGQDKDGATIPFELTEVYIVQPNTDYAVAPALANVTDSKVTAPSLVSNDKFTVANSIVKFKYDDVTGGLYTTQSIYIPEAVVVMGGTSGDENHLNRVAVVVGGSYNNGETTYYRLDFIDSGKNLKDVLRNHLYQFNIASVSGPGFGDPETAYKSLSMNMTVNILTWDEGDMNEIYFDGQSYFAIDKRTVTFSPMGDEMVTYNVWTNIADWSMWPTSDKNQEFGAQGKKTYINSILGFKYEVEKIVGEDNKYTLTVKSTMHNIYSSENTRKEILTIKARLLSIPFTVEQLSTNMYISVVNGQSARLYPEGTYGTANPVIIPIDIMALKPVQVVVSTDGDTWLSVRKSSAAAGSGAGGYALDTRDVVTGLYSVSLQADVKKWTEFPYLTGSRSATITITPQGEDAIVYTITQESPYINLSRSLEYIQRSAVSYSCYVEVQTNIAPEEFLLTRESGSNDNIKITEGLINIDPTRLRNVRFKVEVESDGMDAIRALGDVSTSSTFKVDAAVYSLNKSVQFIVPTAANKFEWIWNNYGANSNTGNFIFPWNIEAASVTVNSNNGVLAQGALGNPGTFSYNVDNTDAGNDKFTVNFTFPKVDMRSTDSYTSTIYNDNASRTATITFRSGFQQFRRSLSSDGTIAAPVAINLGHTGVTSATSLGDVYANVRWTATATDAGSWMTFSDNASTGFTSNKLDNYDHRKTAPVDMATYPAAGTTMDTRTPLYYKAAAFTVADLNGSDRTATITFSSDDYDAAKFSPTIAPVTIKQYAPVLAPLPDPYTPFTGTIPATPTSADNRTITVSTNLSGWGIKIYGGNNTVTIASVSSLNSAATATSSSKLVDMTNTDLKNGGSTTSSPARTLTFKLYCTEFPSTEIDLGTLRQDAYTYVAPTPPSYPAYPGVIGFDKRTQRLTLNGDDGTGSVVMVYFKYGGIIGMYSGSNNDQWKTDGSPIAFNPTDIQVGDYNSFPTPVRTDNSTIGNVDVFHTLAGAKNGNGDPCRFINDDGSGMTATEVHDAIYAPTGADIPNKGYWKLPTNAGVDKSNQSFTGSTTSYTPTGSVLQSSTVNGKTFAGLYFPKGATSGSFLPAAGLRNYSTGAVNYQGTYGYYWSSEPYSASYGYYLLFYASYVYPLSYAYFAYGFSVRCVRQ